MVRCDAERKSRVKILSLCNFAQPTDGAEEPSISANAIRLGAAHLRTVAAAVVETVQAPPAMTFLHALQPQMPTADRFTVSY